MDFDMNSFYRDMERIDRIHAELRDEFTKLCIEPSAKRPNIGDRVIVAVGLLQMGHLWIREEATVLEVADTSFHIEFKDKVVYGTNEPRRVWVHQALITDVLEAK